MGSLRLILEIGNAQKQNWNDEWKFKYKVDNRFIFWAVAIGVNPISPTNYKNNSALYKDVRIYDVRNIRQNIRFISIFMVYELRFYQDTTL